MDICWARSRLGHGPARGLERPAPARQHESGHAPWGCAGLDTRAGLEGCDTSQLRVLYALACVKGSPESGRPCRQDIVSARPWLLLIWVQPLWKVFPDPILCLIRTPSLQSLHIVGSALFLRLRDLSQAINRTTSERLACYLIIPAGLRAPQGQGPTQPRGQHR